MKKAYIAPRMECSVLEAECCMGALSGNEGSYADQMAKERDNHAEEDVAAKDTWSDGYW